MRWNDDPMYDHSAGAGAIGSVFEVHTSNELKFAEMRLLDSLQAYLDGGGDAREWLAFWRARNDETPVRYITR